jgi:hypothetical protein
LIQYKNHPTWIFKPVESAMKTILHPNASPPARQSGAPQWHAPRHIRAVCSGKRAMGAESRARSLAEARRTLQFLTFSGSRGGLE